MGAGGDADCPGRADIGDLALEDAFAIEDLNALVAAIGYVEVAARIGGEGERRIELPLRRAARAPGFQEAAVGIELRDAGLP